MSDLFACDDAEHLDLPGGELLLYRDPDLGASAAALFDELHSGLDWRQEPITLFGKRYMQPRLLAWYADAGLSYRYSGIQHQPLAWTPGLAALRERIEMLTGASFNSVLANQYRDHRDSMGLHADDEPELGQRPVIASLSLGEERVFRLKHRTRRDIKPLRLALSSGTLLIMRGDTQKNWRHEVPKQTKTCGPRINLTFRYVHPELVRNN
ncbi:alpha-ketoglutarate-dependent dioxygenase AlkB [Congregibacter variabilis]|uniref:Alpha-ketoglutarate-dependent dioxygenase AlkB n=1 Tax=Congregibacter variabilis TaxID=3081200 RepID=A0ABZ0I818_9GAMM|nr:alpha-ketoglutarate-dependent dioxygenase AlkB [Congregibacter sp. IMCC43200]